METYISAEILQQLSLLNSPYHTLVKSTVLALVKNVWCRSWVQEDLRDTMVNWGVIPTLIMTLLPAAPDLDVQKGCAYTSLIGFLADDDKVSFPFFLNLESCYVLGTTILNLYFAMMHSYDTTIPLFKNIYRI